jgi:hypothetical protein
MWWRIAAAGAWVAHSSMELELVMVVTGGTD